MTGDHFKRRKVVLLRTHKNTSRSGGKTILDRKKPDNRCCEKSKRRWTDNFERDLETDVTTTERMSLERHQYMCAMMAVTFLKEKALSRERLYKYGLSTTSAKKLHIRGPGGKNEDLSG